MVKENKGHTVSRREFLGEAKFLKEKARLKAVRSERHRRNYWKKSYHSIDCSCDQCNGDGYCMGYGL